MTMRKLKALTYELKPTGRNLLQWNELKIHMNFKNLLDSKRSQILKLVSKYGVLRIQVFGSVARGDTGPESDFDFLVELEPGRSLFDLGGLVSDLELLLKRKVDVVTEAGLRPRLKQRILEEARPL